VDGISFTVHPDSDQDSATGNTAGSPRHPCLHRRVVRLAACSSFPWRWFGYQLPPSHRSTRWTPAARASRRTAALVHVRTCTPSPSRASRQDSTEYYRLDASSNSPRPRCRTEEALDQASSAASAHGNDGGSQPLPRRSLGGERGAGGRAVASETRRRSGAATGEARSQRRRAWSRCPGSGGGRGVDAWTVFHLPSTPLVPENRRIGDVRSRF